MSETTYTDPVSGIEFVFVKGGTYRMGDWSGEGFENELPVHEVTVGDFFIGRYPVTQGQWTRVMGDNPARWDFAPEHPVEMVSFGDVGAFLEKLNAEAEGTCRLPTEAEWEYAARSGGKEERWPGTDDLDVAGNLCWHDVNANKCTQPVGRLKPNGLGLHDMGGNVFEFVADVFADDAYAKHQPVNPVYLGPGEDRVIRGGSWYSYILLCRCMDRAIYGADYRDNYVGFRVVREP